MFQLCEILYRLEDLEIRKREILFGREINRMIRYFNALDSKLMKLLLRTLQIV
jgi:hypothetical protein